MNYTTLLFDLDGTLLDTLDDLTASVNVALSEFQLPLRTKDEIRTFVGNGVRTLLTRAVPDGVDHPKFEAVFNRFVEYYEAHTQDFTKPYDSIMELVHWCNIAGYKLGIVSNKLDGPVKALAQYYFEELFPVAIGESPRIRRKPAPDAVLEAMKLLNAVPEETLFIGDSEVDIETARNAGIPCLSVAWGFRSREFLVAHGATDVVDDPLEVIAFLQS